VPSGFFFGALLDLAPVSLVGSKSAKIFLTDFSVSIAGSDIVLPGVFGRVRRFGVYNRYLSSAWPFFYLSATFIQNERTETVITIFYQRYCI
jgi:hypothetical protein